MGVFLLGLCLGVIVGLVGREGVQRLIALIRGA